MRTLLFVVLVAACSDAPRLDLKDLTLVEKYPLSGNGIAYNIVIGDDVAYVSDEAGFQSFRLTDTDAQPITEYIFEPQTYQANQPLALRGSLLAVAHGARIALVDVSDPAHPQTLSTIIAGSNGTAHALAFDGTYLYWGGINMQRADISDPSAPGTPAVISGQAVNSMLIHGGYIYASAQGRMTIFSLPNDALVNPAAPTVSEVQLPQATNLVLNGPALYGSSGALGQIFVVDVHDPAAPVVIQDYGFGETAGQLVLQGDQLLAPSYTDVTDDYDVSDPLHPVEVAARVVARGYDGAYNFGAARRGDLLLLGNFRGLLVLYPTLR